MESDKKSEKLFWPFMILVTVYCGFWDVSNIIEIVFWSAWAIVSLLYAFSFDSYERSLLLKIGVFISLIIVVFSLYGFSIQQSAIIDEFILNSGFSQPIKTLILHTISCLLAVLVAFLFAPIAVKVGGKHLFLFCLSGAVFPILINEYLYALFLVLGGFLSFYFYRQFIYAKP